LRREVGVVKHPPRARLHPPTQTPPIYIYIFIYIHNAEP
jgi:hypothetical protein